MQPLLAIFGTLGAQELLIIGAIVFLLFGNRLPSVMRSLGRGLVEFRKGASGVDDETGDNDDRSQRNDQKGEKKTSRLEASRDELDQSKSEVQEEASVAADGRE